LKLNIRLTPVNRKNWEDVITLEVFDGQSDFVADNVYSLAEASVKPECVPMAICHGDELVGFLRYVNPGADEHEYWVLRFMIDKNHQRKGYGRAAMRLVLDIINQDKKYNKVYLSFEPDNLAAKAMYENFGFVPDGRVEYGEIVYVLHY
jgi:diamine N-acetyltransferase